MATKKKVKKPISDRARALAFKKDQDKRAKRRKEVQAKKNKKK